VPGSAAGRLGRKLEKRHPTLLTATTYTCIYRTYSILHTTCAMAVSYMWVCLLSLNRDWKVACSRGDPTRARSSTAVLQHTQLHPLSPLAVCRDLSIII